jgi:hypothetical protein
MTENDLGGQSPQGSTEDLWFEQTPLRTSWHLLRRSGLHAWERFLAGNPSLTEKELHSIRLLAILYDRNPIPLEYQSVEAISVCLGVLVSGAGKTGKLIVPSPAQAIAWLTLLGLSVAERDCSKRLFPISQELCLQNRVRHSRMSNPNWSH